MEIINVPKTRTPKPSIMIPQRKQLILNFYREYRRVKGVSPKFQDVAVGIGFSSNSEGTAFNYVQQLVAEGWLKQAVPGARGIIPTVKAETEVYAPITDDDLKSVARQQRNLRILRRL